MGLDSWFVVGSVKNHTEIKYFRKFHTLHQILAQEWMKQHKENDDWNFNCVHLRIGRRIVKILRKYCSEYETRPELQEDWDWENKWKELSAFLDEIDSIINNGERVYYYSWW